MRTIIELPDDLREAIEQASEEDRTSRAETVRRALRMYLRQRGRPAGEEVFGLWKDRPEEGREYEDRLREEWASR